MSRHLHLRAFTGRPATIADHVVGHAVNPASQPTLSRIPMQTLAASYRQGRTPASASLSEEPAVDGCATAAREVVGWLDSLRHHRRGCGLTANTGQP